MRVPIFLLAFIAVLAAREPVLLVLNKSDSTLAFIDPVALKVMTTVAAGKDPHEIVTSADGRLAFISNYSGGHTLSVVDLETRQPLPPVELGALRAPHGLTEANGKIWFTAEGSKVIGSCDPATRQVDWVLGLGQERTHMIALSRDFSKVFTTNISSDSISLLQRGQGDSWSISHLPVGRGPEGFDLSPDEKELWAANSRDGSVSIIDLAQKSVVQTLQVRTKASNRLKFSPDGKLVLISDIGGKELVIIDAASRKEVKRLPLHAPAGGILMDPSGSRAFVALGPDNGIVVVDLKSLEITGQLETGKNPDGMAWAR